MFLLLLVLLLWFLVLLLMLLILLLVFLVLLVLLLVFLMLLVMFLLFVVALVVVIVLGSVPFLVAVVDGAMDGFESLLVGDFVEPFGDVTEVFTGLLVEEESENIDQSAGHKEISESLGVTDEESVVLEVIIDNLDGFAELVIGPFVALGCGVVVAVDGLNQLVNSWGDVSGVEVDPLVNLSVTEF